MLLFEVVCASLYQSGLGLSGNEVLGIHGAAYHLSWLYTVPHWTLYPWFAQFFKFLYHTLYLLFLRVVRVGDCCLSLRADKTKVLHNFSFLLILFFTYEMFAYFSQNRSDSITSRCEVFLHIDDHIPYRLINIHQQAFLPLMCLIYIFVTPLLEASLLCHSSLFLGEMREIDHLRFAYYILDDLLDVILLKGQHLVYWRLW